MSLDTDDTHPEARLDRRVSVRRKEDYFWLKRMADVTDEACLVVNRNMLIDFIDDKIFDLLTLDRSECGNLEEFGQLTSIMAAQGYFGRGNPKMFEALISDLLINQRLKQNKATQIINAVTPSGRHIDIRVSLGRDDGFLVLMRDNTKEELKKRALDTALLVGKSGYWFYNLHTGEFHLRADSLQQHYTTETFESIRSNGFLNVIHPDDRTDVKAAIDKTITSSQPVDNLCRIVGDDGEIQWLKAHIMPNIDEGGRVRSLSCFFINVTEQILIQHDLQAAQEKAEAALKAKNEFLGRLSHEVRTPMNAVIGMADALVHNCSDPDILPKLSLIQNSAEKVVDMVDETLVHTKLAEDAIELNLREGSPSDLVRQICAKWQTKAQAKQTTLTCTVHNTVPDTITFDEFRYEQCLNNLLSNALKFSQGGSVSVILTTTGNPDNRQLVLAVRDTGIGMTEANLETIFLPFRQADKTISSRFGGTGLGLSIVKDLTELMGGRVTVKSEPNKGTLFAISLPIEAKEVKFKESASDSLVDQLLEQDAPKDGPYSKLRVLIVDDNATNHIVVSSLLSNLVGDIETALNGEEALARLEEQTFDIVLMDIHMPVMDGIETTLAIRSKESSYQNVPIIALTADPQYQQSRLCRNIGMNSSLAKPIKLAGLLQAFDELLISQSNGVANAA